MSQEDRVCLHAFFSGWVQGVGFRFTTVHVARGYEVVGFVRNLPDSRVELMAEGARQEVERFFAAVQGKMGRHIEKTQVNWLPATGGFEDFDVRY